MSESKQANRIMTALSIGIPLAFLTLFGLIIYFSAIGVEG